MSRHVPLLGGRERARNLAVALREAFTAGNDLVIPHLVQQGFDDLRPAHAAVFQYLDDTGTTVSGLAQRAHMTKQAMAELIAHLEQNGYVSRTPDPADRRAQTLVPEIEDRVAAVIGEDRLRLLREDLDAIQREFDGTAGRL